MKSYTAKILLRIGYMTIGLAITYMILNIINRYAQEDRIWGYSLPQFLFLTAIAIYFGSLIFIAPPRKKDLFPTPAIPMYNNRDTNLLRYHLKLIFSVTIILIVCVLIIQIISIIPPIDQIMVFGVFISQFIVGSLLEIYLVLIILIAINFGLKHRRLKLSDPQMAAIITSPNSTRIRQIGIAFLISIGVGGIFLILLMSGVLGFIEPWFELLTDGEFSLVEIRIMMMIGITIITFIILNITAAILLPKPDVRSINAITVNELPSPQDLISMIKRQLTTIARISTINTSNSIYPILSPQAEASDYLMPLKEYKKTALYKTLLYIGIAVAVYLFIRYVPVFDVTL